MNITSYEYLLALEEIGTISGTAERFFVSPSAISQCLKHAEEQEGYPLFERTGKKMVPTKAGEIYLKGARTIVRIREKTYEELQIISTQEHAIRIAIVPMLYSFLYSDLITFLNETFPRKHFELISTDSKLGLAYLQNHFVDFAILTIPSLDQPLLSGHVLGQDTTRLVIPRAYLRHIITTEPQISDCSNIPLILLKKGTFTRSFQDKILTRNHVTQNRVYEVDNHVIARDFLMEGRGAAFLPTCLIPKNAEDHFYILPVDEAFSFRFTLVWANQQKMTQSRKKIIDGICEWWRNRADRPIA